MTRRTNTNADAKRAPRKPERSRSASREADARLAGSVSALASAALCQIALLATDLRLAADGTAPTDRARKLKLRTAERRAVEAGDLIVSAASAFTAALNPRAKVSGKARAPRTAETPRAKLPQKRKPGAWRRRRNPQTQGGDA